ncbi:MAG: hypothetical protein CMI09_01090 [Oceanospirillaceae bacterium]|nr:hypothetical protein [Oceanospirillaceae bacterium]|tara:strand:+ start:21983 stop:22225 length:243 start_codon:yes stop_codon:yes gene_type:complete
MNAFRKPAPLSLKELVRRVLHRLYLVGYQGRDLPRPVRKMIARTQFHRAWFAGRLGVFEECDVMAISSDGRGVDALDIPF